MADLRPELDVTAAAAFLRGHLGPDVADVRPLAGGELSRAFALRLAGRALVLRVAADGAGFARDLDAFQRFAGPDLPIPRIIETGRLDTSSMVSRTIALDEVNEAFTAMEKGEVVRSVITSF